MELLGCLMANYSVGMASSCYQVPQQTWNLVGWLLSAMLFIFRKWSCMHCSDPFRLLFCFVNCRFTDCFHCSVLCHFALRLMHVPIRFGSSAVASPGLCLIFSECLICGFFHHSARFCKVHLASRSALQYAKLQWSLPPTCTPTSVSLWSDFHTTDVLTDHPRNNSQSYRVDPTNCCLQIFFFSKDYTSDRR